MNDDVMLEKIIEIWSGRKSIPALKELLQQNSVCFYRIFSMLILICKQ